MKVSQSGNMFRLFQSFSDLGCASAPWTEPGDAFSALRPTALVVLVLLLVPGFLLPQTQTVHTGLKGR